VVYGLHHCLPRPPYGKILDPPLPGRLPCRPPGRRHGLAPARLPRPLRRPFFPVPPAFPSRAARIPIAGRDPRAHRFSVDRWLPPPSEAPTPISRRWHSRAPGPPSPRPRPTVGAPLFSPTGTTPACCRWAPAAVKLPTKHRKKLRNDSLRRRVGRGKPAHPPVPRCRSLLPRRIDAAWRRIDACECCSWMLQSLLLKADTRMDKVARKM
jgi:hypothetical protein